MRNLFLKAVCLVLMGMGAVLCAPPGDLRVRLQLVDESTGKPCGGIIRISESDSDKPLELLGLFKRLRGLEKSQRVSGWYVVPRGGASITLPRKRLQLEALSGLETALARRDLELGTQAPDEVTIQVPRLFDPARLELAAGNTHLHLRNLSLDESDEYLRQIPAADGLRVLFISYLERHKEDASYITNRYPIGELKQFGATGVLYSNGEEHRHNFDGFGQGFGHVMFLGIRNLVRPVSLGAGITGSGFDDRPLRPGIDEAKHQGGTVIWCHNNLGFESVPTALAGLLDALNVFDGSRNGKFEDNYYRFLNIGLKIPISTGTDWFLYDFSRVYAQVQGPLTIQSWLDAVKAGRSTATNGPLLTLRVDGAEVGATLKLDRSRTVHLEGTAIGRHNFERLELIHNGKVIYAEQAKNLKDRYEAKISREIPISSPGWLALRIQSSTKNELGNSLYAHTSPIYVEVGGRGCFDVEAARTLLRQVEENAASIRARGHFSKPEAADKLLAIYDKTAQDLRTRMSRRGE